MTASAARETSHRRPASEHGEREHADQRKAREGPHAPHEHEVLVQEAVERGLGAEGEDDGEGRSGDRDRPVAAGRRRQSRDPQRQETEAGEERVRRLEV
jgi:hypothetical protein